MVKQGVRSNRTTSEGGDNSLEVELLRSELTSHSLEIQNQYLAIERIVANNVVNKELLEIIIGKLDELLVVSAPSRK